MMPLQSIAEPRHRWLDCEPDEIKIPMRPLGKAVVVMEDPDFLAKAYERTFPREDGSQGKLIVLRQFQGVRLLPRYRRVRVLAINTGQVTREREQVYYRREWDSLAEDFVAAVDRKVQIRWQESCPFTVGDWVWIRYNMGLETVALEGGTATVNFVGWDQVEFVEVPDGTPGSLMFTTFGIDIYTPSRR